MKKILIATIEFPPQRGGVANYLAGLIGALPPDKAAVLAPKMAGVEQFDGGKPYKIYRKNLVSHLPFVWPKWLLTIWHLWRTARREKAEAILVGQVLPVGTAAYFLNKIFVLPYFVSCHGMDILTAAESPRKKKLMSKIFEQASGIIANSEFTKKELIGLAVPENKITVIYPCPGKEEGIGREKVEEIRKKLGLADKKIILTVGRLVARKGQDKVIEAMPKILEKIPNAIYVIVGNGPEREKLQVLSSKFQDNILFAGELSEAKKIAFYQLCDVFAMVPRQIGPDVEGFGTVYLEANRFNKPVIAGRSGGVAEAVADGVTGLIVEPENINQIAEAVIKVLVDKNLADKLGAAGQERVEKEFRWEVQAEKLKNILI
jgi:phosphatidylinositol alpha-1,6-mannosyltransferase